MLHPIKYCPSFSGGNTRVAPLGCVPRPGSVVAERSSGMREVGCSIPGRVKQKDVKI